MTPNVRLEVEDNIVILVVNEEEVPPWPGSKIFHIITPFTQTKTQVDVRWMDRDGYSIPVFDLKSKWSILKNVILDERFYVEKIED